MAPRAVLIAVTVTVAAFAAPAAAGPLPTGWGLTASFGDEFYHYNGDFRPYLVGYDPTGHTVTDLVFDLQSVTGETGPQRVAVATLTSDYNASTEDDNNRDYFHDPYTLRLTFTDASGQAGSVTLAGRVDGWTNGYTVMLTSEFTSPAAQTLTLGGTRYTVSDPQFVAPNKPYFDPWDEGRNWLSAGGEISVEVSPAAATPEPGTLILAGVGLAGLGGAWRRAAGGPTAQPQRPRP